MNEQSTYPLDVEMLNTLRALQPEGDADVIGELFDMFQSVAPPLLEKIRVAVAQRDSELLYKSAHSLKGNSASLGATTLAALLKELELMGRMGDLQGATEKIAQVEKEFERALHALENERNQVPV